MQGRKPGVKWPKSNSKEWETINTDLSLGDLNYSYREEKFGVKEQVK